MGAAEAAGAVDLEAAAPAATRLQNRLRVAGAGQRMVLKVRPQAPPAPTLSARRRHPQIWLPPTSGFVAATTSSGCRSCQKIRPQAPPAPTLSTALPLRRAGRDVAAPNTCSLVLSPGKASGDIGGLELGSDPQLERARDPAGFPSAKSLSPSTPSSTLYSAPYTLHQHGGYSALSTSARKKPAPQRPAQTADRKSVV